MGLLVFFLLLYFTNDCICTAGEKEEIVLADWGRIRAEANEVLDRCSTDQDFLCQEKMKAKVCSCKEDCRERGSCCIDQRGSEVAIRTGRSWSCLAVQTSLCHSHHLQMVSSYFQLIQVLQILLEHQQKTFICLVLIFFRCPLAHRDTMIARLSRSASSR